MCGQPPPHKIATMSDADDDVRHRGPRVDVLIEEPVVPRLTVSIDGGEHCQHGVAP